MTHVLSGVQTSSCLNAIRGDIVCGKAGTGDTGHIGSEPRGHEAHAPETSAVPVRAGTFAIHPQVKMLDTIKGAM